jgi:hypothetical protein
VVVRAGARARSHGEHAKRWTTPRAEGSRPLRPVQVIEAPPCWTLTIVSPSELRVEGVTIADAIEILRGLA